MVHHLSNKEINKCDLVNVPINVDSDVYLLQESYSNLMTPESNESDSKVVEIKEVCSPSKFFVIPKQTPETKPLTLVLDLDETLIHFTDLSPDKRASLPHLTTQENIYGGFFTIRPYALSFISEMSEMFEIIVFTAGTKCYADWILNQIDQSNYISHRLYRHHTMPEGEVYIKDLDLLNRDLKTTIIVDNLKQNYMYHKENGIEINSWIDDFSD
jgi:Dullard-like phosphatase family protein